MALLPDGQGVHPARGSPTRSWLPFLKPLLSGVFTADNMDYVLRDAYMCGVAVGPIDIDRIIYYAFFCEQGLTLDRSGLQAFIMFLNARFYMYTNVYYHRTTRGIDLHLKEIFRDTMRLAFPYDLRKELHPYLHLTEWTLLEEVGRWHDGRHDPERSGRSAPSGGISSTGGSSGGCRARRSSTSSSPARVRASSTRRRWSAACAASCPPGSRTFPFKIDMALQDPRPLNPLKMGDRQIYVYDSATERVAEEPLTEILKYLPGKVAQCRIFATSHEHDAELAVALKRALNEEPPSIVTNV